MTLIANGTPEQIALARAKNRRKYHKRAAKLRAATPPQPVASATIDAAPPPPPHTERPRELSDRLEKIIAGMVADGHTFDDMESAGPTMPLARVIAAWATDKERYPRFVRRYQSAQLAWAERQMQALSKAAGAAAGKTKIDGLRFHIQRLERQLGADGAAPVQSFSDHAPAWLKQTIASALAATMNAGRPASHQSSDPLQVDE